jgi:hypothetical protein
VQNSLLSTISQYHGSPTHATDHPNFFLMHFPNNPLPITPYLLHFTTLKLVSSLSLPEGRAGTAWEPLEKQTFLTPHDDDNNNNNNPSVDT